MTVGDGQVAYQVVGDGPTDIVWCLGFGSQVDLAWQAPFLADFFHDLARGRRLILFDRRGTGLSDPVSFNALPTWEAFAEDLLAVLDVVGSRRAAVFGAVETGPIAILFAAMHPDRVSHLLLSHTTARFLKDDDYPIGATEQTVDEVISWFVANWGTDHLVRTLFSGYVEEGEETVDAMCRLFRAWGTPNAAATQLNYFIRGLDVRHVLPSVSVPTLVMHSDGAMVPAQYGRYIAEHIPKAKYVELPGNDLSVISPELLAEIVEFVTGERPATEVRRILTTVLFTDIVGSTDRAVALGDQKWRALLDGHDRVVREQVRRFRGKEITSSGDGFFISFDGPARAIRSAQAIGEALDTLDLQVRAGLHTGECEVRGDGLSGLTVHIAARVAALAEPGEVLVSGTVKDLVIGSGIEFADRGDHELKGVPGSWKLFAVER